MADESSLIDVQEAQSKAQELQKTPARPTKGTKRKFQSPVTPSGKPDVEKSGGSAKKRRKSLSGTPTSRTGSPGGTLLKPAMTERQQMALLLQMTDPQKQASVEQAHTAPSIETTPRSRTQRRNERGETQLHIACIKGDLQTATSLVEQGAEVNSVDHAGWTPLHEACNYGHDSVVSLLLKYHANVNAKGMDGDTPMHDAVINTHTQCVKLLLEHGGDPTLANDQGMTPIDMCKHPDILKLLKTEHEDDSEPDVFEPIEGSPTVDKRIVQMESEISVSEPVRGETGDSKPATSNQELNSSVEEEQNRARSFPRGRSLFYSDISSSESESELLDAAAKRVKYSKPYVVELKQRLQTVSEDEERAPTQVEALHEEEMNPDDRPQTDKYQDIKIVDSGSSVDESKSATDGGSTEGTIEQGNGDTKKSAPDISDTLTSSHPDKERSLSQTAEIRAEGTAGYEMDNSSTSAQLHSPQSCMNLPTVSTMKSPTSVTSLLPTEITVADKDSLVVAFPLSLVKLSQSAVDGSKDIQSRGSCLDASGVGTMEKRSLVTSEVKPHTEKNEATKADSRLLPPEYVSPGKVVERRDSTSSQDSRSSISGEKYTKHSRKPQHVIPSRRQGKDEVIDDEVRTSTGGSELTEADSFSISVDWGVLPSQQCKQTPLKLGRQHTPPSSESSKKLHVDIQDSNDITDTSKSTVISLPTSLPIVFSGLRDTQHTMSTSTSSTKLHSGNDWVQSKDTLATPPSFKPKTLPILLESVMSASAPATPQKRERGASQQFTFTSKEVNNQADSEGSHVVLPPKRRHRVVYKSSIVQQRQKQMSKSSMPANFSSFLMSSGKYHSKKDFQPTNPKSVYPPLHAALYKLFTEQELERIRLIASHCTEQDRMVLSMEQEILRAYQRATKCSAPISACAVLQEQLLLKQLYERSTSSLVVTSCGDSTDVLSTLRDGCSDTVDDKLLTGLIQDVWDKFYQLKMSLLTRQKHEAEALWMVQRLSWIDKVADLGFSYLSGDQEIPSAHVPLATLLIKHAM